MSEQTDLLREIRDLLLLLAEPAIAERDKKLREALLTTVGKSKPKAKSVLLMNGSRSQVDIRKQTKIDAGALSRLVKSLQGQNLLVVEDGKPRLVISIPTDFFDLK